MVLKQTGDFTISYETFACVMNKSSKNIYIFKNNVLLEGTTKLIKAFEFCCW